MPSSFRFGGRTLSRCQALQILFQAEACDRSVDDVLSGEYILSKGPLNEYGERLARGVGSHLPELDAVLSGAARNWSLSRMSSTDRNLLRLALYELLYVDEVEAAVSISECVELAKAFGSSDESSRFVNGILGRIQSQIDAGVDVVEEGRRREAEEAGELAAAADAGAERELGLAEGGEPQAAEADEARADAAAEASADAAAACACPVSAAASGDEASPDAACACSEAPEQAGE